MLGAMKGISRAILVRPGHWRHVCCRPTMRKPLQKSAKSVLESLATFARRMRKVVRPRGCPFLYFSKSNTRRPAFVAVLVAACCGWLLLSLILKRPPPAWRPASEDEYILQVAAEGAPEGPASPSGETPPIRIPVSRNSTFELRYIHSSELIPVRGVFRVAAPGKILAESSSSTSFGPGLPFETTAGKWEFKGGWMTVTDLGIELDHLPIMVSPKTRQTLVVAGREYVLESLFPPGTCVDIRIEPLR